MINYRLKKGLYKHFKGNLYEILDVAEHTESGNQLVIYKSILDYKVYARPLEMFLSKVDKEKYPNADQEYRFQFVGDK